MRKLLITLYLMFVLLLSFMGCQHTWEKSVESIFKTEEMELTYGPSRTTFYTCPYSDRNPRMPIVRPIEMVKDKDLGWTLRSIGLSNTHSDYHKIDLMFGDSLCIYFHTIDTAYTINGISFHDQEYWVVVNLHEKLSNDFIDNDSFMQNVGQEIIRKMISPDTYYKMFYNDPHSLPWIVNRN